MSKHTPEPMPHDPLAMAVFNSCECTECKKMKRFIAAAPKLLEALEILMEYWDNGNPVHAGALAVSNARAAIRKAQPTNAD